MIDTRLNFKHLVNRFDTRVEGEPITFTPDECAIAQATLNHVCGLLDDIGIDADKKYNVAEVEQLQAAVEWVLGGAK